MMALYFPFNKALRHGDMNQQKLLQNGKRHFGACGQGKAVIGCGRVIQVKP